MLLYVMPRTKGFSFLIFFIWHLGVVTTKSILRASLLGFKVNYISLYVCYGSQVIVGVDGYLLPTVYEFSKC